MENVKYVFFGTPEFAAIILEKLIKAGFVPQAVVCNPDRPIGRKQIVTPPPVKQVIRNEKLETRVKILQPENLSSLIFHLSPLNPDLFIVAAYTKIIPKEILDIPRLGVIGVHPSLLPKYRGAMPIQTAILNGEKETGVSLFLTDEKEDHGKILSEKKLEIGNENYQGLSKKLVEIGAELLIKTLPEFLAGKITPLSQDESQATYTKKFKTEDAYVDLAALQLAIQGEPRPDGREKAIEIERKVRALNPEPGVWAIKDGKRMKILEAELTTGENKLKLKKIQFEGKKAVEI